MEKILKSAIEKAVQHDRKSRKVSVEESRKHAARAIHNIMARAHARAVRGVEDDSVALQEFKRDVEALGVDWATAAEFGTVFFGMLRKPKGLLSHLRDFFENTGA